MIAAKQTVVNEVYVVVVVVVVVVVFNKISLYLLKNHKLHLFF